MQKWEYKLTSRITEDEMIVLGAQGWELISAITANSIMGESIILFWRRPKT